MSFVAVQFVILYSNGKSNNFRNARFYNYTKKKEYYET